MKTNSLTNQEPWEKEFDQLFEGGEIVFDDPFSHPVEVKDRIKAFISKWIQQERADTAGKVLSDVARYVDPKEFKKLCSKYIMHSEK